MSTETKTIRVGFRDKGDRVTVAFDDIHKAIARANRVGTMPTVDWVAVGETEGDGFMGRERDDNGDWQHITAGDCGLSS